MKARSAVASAVLCSAVSLLVAACGERSPSPTTGAPAEAQPARTVQLNMASVFPTSLTLIGEAAPQFAARVKRASGGSIEIKVFEPGALVPALETIQAVSKGSVATAWSSTRTAFTAAHSRCWSCRAFCWRYSSRRVTCYRCGS